MLHIKQIPLPVSAVYPLGFADGPITTSKVVLFLAMILGLSKAGHLRQVNWTPVHRFAGERPR